MLLCSIIINVLTAITAVFVAHEAARTAGVDVVGYFLESLQITPSSPAFFDTITSRHSHHDGETRVDPHVSNDRSVQQVEEMVEPTLNHLPYLLNETEAKDRESEEADNAHPHRLIHSSNLTPDMSC